MKITPIKNGFINHTSKMLYTLEDIQEACIKLGFDNEKMFDELAGQFENALKSLKGEAKITDGNVDDALKQVRRALLEADVSLAVIKDFIEEVRTKAIGADVVRGVSPDQKFIQIVHEELVNIMGGTNTPLVKREDKPTIILMDPSIHLFMTDQTKVTLRQ